jgi:multiple sugar transport system permease protein|tara:strand:+ start:8484 stop:9422 length:939 start_codon:yes stop_codon:yes gene_type:complete
LTALDVGAKGAKVAGVAKKRRPKNSILNALPWIGPALALIIAVVVWPAIELIKISLTKITSAGALEGFNGLENYRMLFENPDLGAIVMRTLVWVGSVVSITVILSMPLAQLINQNFPGRKFVRWAMIVPWAASVVMTSIVWKWMLELTSGEFNLTLRQLGLQDQPVDWLRDPRYSFFVLIWVAVFVSIPFTTFVLLAGLQSIPHDIIEAAQVDGATSWQIYRGIKFPLLRNALLIATIINLINVFNSFPIIWALTRGGPGYNTDTTITFAYKMAFVEYNMGPSTALGVINFAFIMLIVLIYLRVTKATRGQL